MRSLSTISTLLALTTGAFAAPYSSKYDGGEFTDPTLKPRPTGTPFSYYPNSFGACASGAGSIGTCCGSANGQEPCGPLNWPFISADTSKTCLAATGGQQTPINLDLFEGPSYYEDFDKNEGKLVFSKTARCAGKITKKTDSWQMDFLGECGDTVFTVTDAYGKKWKLFQMHIHGPSEHTINGAYSPVEVHLVHIPFEGAATQGLVLGVMLTPGKSNQVMSVLTGMDADAATGTKAPKPINPYQLLPQDKGYFHYTGSLTAPGTLAGPNGGCQLNANGANFDPAKNNIQWYVFKNPTPVTAAQLAWFTDYTCQLSLAYLCQTNRPLQKIESGTKVYSYGKSLNW